MGIKVSLRVLCVDDEAWMCGGAGLQVGLRNVRQICGLSTGERVLHRVV